MLNKNQVKQKIKNNLSNLDVGAGRLASMWNTTNSVIKTAKRELRAEGYKYTRPSRKLAKPSVTASKSINTLIIPDLHIPFEHPEALNFCYNLYKTWNCERVIFLGDLIDNHFSSFHDISTKAKGADEELQLAKEALAKWYKAFPEAYVCTSNHDSIPERKVEFSKLSKEWLRPINEVLEIPNWKFKDSWEFDNCICIHGTDGKSIRNKLFKYGGNKSIIQGHFHSDTKLEFYNNNIWGLQLGALIDREAYAFEYAKNTANSAILSAAVIKDGVPIIKTLK